jgi:glycosyltransferase involved in cell wall biosynthesis
MLEGGALAYHRWRKKIWYSVWEKRYMKRAALLHATSEKEKLTLDGLAIGPEVVCVPNGLWPPERHSDVNQPGAWLDPESLVVLYLGRLHPSKRIDILVDAVEIARQANDRIQLVLAGVTDGVDVQSTLRRSQAFCRWIGELDENSKWAVLDSAHLLVMCSDSESFGMSVLEALAVGTPVVVTKTCPWKIVEDARCGRWVLQRADEIAKAILEILADPHQARAMGERGRKLVSARYSWRAIGQEMQRQYDGVLASHR